MNQRLAEMKRRVREGTHRSQRKTEPVHVWEECEAGNLSWMQRVARLTVRQCEAEAVVIAPDERIVFTRTLPARIPEIYSVEQLAGRTFHEAGPINNITADWGMALSQGLLGRRQVALDRIERVKSDPQMSAQARAESIEFLNCAIETIDAVLGLAARYASAARAAGRDDLAQILEHVPAYPPRTFHEALQSLRLMHSVLWLSGHSHVTLGRFDQYMWPYLKADLDQDRIDENEAADLLTEFFITLNKDSDLYPGVQQGDNGQTMTLGGVDRAGNDGVNELTYMILKVSRDLGMIDPKVNLRISKNTDLELLCLATELTRKGLGFPQYSNEDVVIPGLVAHGYRLEDAREFGVAACWEFIIPGRGMEIVNIGAVSFPAAADRAIREGLLAGDDMDGILRRTAVYVDQQVRVLADAYKNVLLPPAPYYSVLMTGCLENGRDLSTGSTYNNYGIHGAGSSNAADALAAVKQFIFEDTSVSVSELLAALDANYEGYEDLRLKLAEQGPKVGNDDPHADSLLVSLFDMLADACEHYGKTSRGGILRPGTGSAMYYIWLAQGRAGMREPVVGATAEGRRKGQPLGANLSPAQGSPVRGPLSVLLSFSKIDYRRICNGGPITMELSDSVFRDEESIRKVAMLVRTFAQLGCQQMQLNSLDVAQLRDAQVHPEQHKNLIVRVWGWSGYFTELSPEYQEQIIARHMYATA